MHNLSTNKTIIKKCKQWHQFKKLSFSQKKKKKKKKKKKFSSLHFHANVKCVWKMYAKYQTVSVKAVAVVWVDFPATHYLCTSHTKWLSSISSHSNKNLHFGIHLLHAHAKCVYCVCKVSDPFSKSSATSWFPSVSTDKSHISAKKNSELSFCQKYFLGIKLLHANVQCVDLVHAKHKNVSVKSVLWVDFPTYVLSVHQQKSIYEKSQRAIILTKLENVFVKHYPTNHMNAPKDNRGIIKILLNFSKIWSGHLHLGHNQSYVWYHDPRSSSSPVILFTRLLYYTKLQLEKEDNSAKYLQNFAKI